jgi:hypothetical protein
MKERGKQVACHLDWPLFYMNDFSKMGLVVGKLEQAVQVLEKNGYRVVTDAQGSALEVTDREQLRTIFDTLTRHQVDFETADLISCVYQG